MTLLTNAVRLGEPGGYFVIDLREALETKRMQMISRRKRFDSTKPCAPQTTRQNDVAVHPTSTDHECRETHSNLKCDSCLFREDCDRPVPLRDAQQFVEDGAHGRWLPGEMRGERISPAGMRLISIRKLPPAIRTAPQFRQVSPLYCSPRSIGRSVARFFVLRLGRHFSIKCRSVRSPLATIKARIMTEAAAVIDVGRQGEEREVLPVHVVLQIEDPRETRSGDLRFIPGAVGPLSRK